MNASTGEIRMMDLWHRSLRFVQALVMASDESRAGVSVSCRSGVRMVQITPNFHSMPGPHERERREEHRASKQDMKAALHELQVKLTTRRAQYKP